MASGHPPIPPDPLSVLPFVCFGAGTSGEGYGCTSCPAGQFSLIGGSCEDCPEGTYSNAGERIHCLA
jgi:hypothetical protein